MTCRNWMHFWKPGGSNPMSGKLWTEVIIQRSDAKIKRSPQISGSHPWSVPHLQGTLQKVFGRRTLGKINTRNAGNQKFSSSGWWANSLKCFKDVCTVPNLFCDNYESWWLRVIWNFAALVKNWTRWCSPSILVALMMHPDSRRIWVKLNGFHTNHGRW